MDFIRFLHGPLLSLIGFVLFVIIGSIILKKTSNLDVNLINKVRNWLLIFSLASVAWFAFSAATVNETPRKVIDRSIVNDRADTLRENSSKALEDFKKKEGQ